jgi:cation diffusion facilitator family transporter
MIYNMGNNNRYQATKNITLFGIAGNSLLCIVKVAVALIGKSQALLADGMHSFADLFTDILVIIAAKTGVKLPDQEHPYGHGRIETVFTVILGIALLVVSIGIVFDAGYVIIYKKFLVPTFAVLIAAAISIIINEVMFYYTMRVAEKVNSNLLRANAWHKRSDSLSSVIVLIGAVGAMAGIHYADAIAAILVAVFIVKMGIQLTWSGLQELIDTGLDTKSLQDVTNTALATPDVIAVHQLRTRSIAGNYFVEMHVQVAAQISVSESHHIGDRVAKRIMNKFKHISEVLVHIDIEHDGEIATNVKLPSRAEIEQDLLPLWRDLPGYSSDNKMNIHYQKQHIIIELFLPIKILQKHKQPEIMQLYKTTIADISYINNIEIYFY